MNAHATWYCNSISGNTVQRCCDDISQTLLSLSMAIVKTSAYH